MPNQYASLDEEIKAKVARARMRGEWFQNSHGAWLTPDQYEMEYDLHKITGTVNTVGWLRAYNPADPKMGILSRIAEANKTLIELQRFSKIVFDYSALIEKNK